MRVMVGGRIYEVVSVLYVKHDRLRLTHIRCALVSILTADLRASAAAEISVLNMITRCKRSSDYHGLNVIYDFLNRMGAIDNQNLWVAYKAMVRSHAGDDV